MVEPVDALSDEIRPWADGLFDDDVAMLWNPPGSLDDEGVPARSLHQVPQTAWYLLDLLQRGHADAAAAVADSLIALQYDAPGTPWDGTFARFLEWPEPGGDAREFEDFDPNWRQFVGVVFVLVLRRHRALLSDRRARDLEDAVARAVAGEQASGRLPWYYTNIALQHAWLLVEAGEVDAGERLAERIARHWREHGAFPEFNSPTYDGVDLWALALWRGHSSSARLRAWGAELEAGLWRTVGERYHAGLANIAGPYGRAYGLDLRRHVAKVALVMAAGDVPDPPLPRLADAPAHAHDFLALPALALAPPRIPDDVRDHLGSFRGERALASTITTRPTRREASAWLGDDVMIGAEDGDSNWTGWFQFVAGTVHWRRGDGAIGVLRYVPEGPPAGRAEPGVLRIGPGRVEVHGPEPDGVVHTTRREAGDPGVGVLEPGRTSLDGLDVRLTPHGGGFTVEVDPTGP